MMILVAINALVLAPPTAHRLCSQGLVSAPHVDGTEPRAPYAESAAGLRVRGGVSARRMRVGGSVALRIALVNEREYPVTIMTGAATYAARVTRNDVVIWEYPRNDEVDGMQRGVPAIGCKRPLPPLKPVEYGVTWDLTDSEGHPVAPGEYVVYQLLRTLPEVSPPPPVVITVEPPRRQSPARVAPSK